MSEFSSSSSVYFLSLFFLTPHPKRTQTNAPSSASARNVVDIASRQVKLFNQKCRFTQSLSLISRWAGFSISVIVSHILIDPILPFQTAQPSFRNASRDAIIQFATLLMQNTLGLSRGWKRYIPPIGLSCGWNRYIPSSVARHWYSSPWFAHTLTRREYDTRPNLKSESHAYIGLVPEYLSNDEKINMKLILTLGIDSWCFWSS